MYKMKYEIIFKNGKIKNVVSKDVNKIKNYITESFNNINSVKRLDEEKSEDDISRVQELVEENIPELNFSSIGENKVGDNIICYEVDETYYEEHDGDISELSNKVEEILDKSDLITSTETIEKNIYITLK